MLAGGSEFCQKIIFKIKAHFSLNGYINKQTNKQAPIRLDTTQLFSLRLRQVLSLSTCETLLPEYRRIYWTLLIKKWTARLNHYY